jgi:hypothetical protein
MKCEKVYKIFITALSPSASTTPDRRRFFALAFISPTMIIFYRHILQNEFLDSSQNFEVLFSYLPLQLKAVLLY